MKQYQLCPNCRRAFLPKPTGRPPTFCGAACRQRAYRRRRRLLARVMGLEYARRRWADYRTEFPKIDHKAGIF